jgi:phasin family protein
MLVPCLGRKMNSLQRSSGEWPERAYCISFAKFPPSHPQTHFHGAVMSTPIPEQLVSARKAGVASFFGLAAKAFESVEKLAALNLQAVKSTLAENEELLTKSLSVRVPQEWFALTAGLTQPAAAKAASYGREVWEVALNAQGAFLAVTAAQVQQYQRDSQVMVENFGKTMPAGTDTLMMAWKSAISSGSEAAETEKKSA